MGKKFFALLLVISLLCTACAARPDSEEPQPTPDATAIPSPIQNYTLMDCVHEGTSGLWETPVGQQLFALTQVYLDVSYASELAAGQNVQEYLNTLIASDNLPDFIAAGEQVTELIQADKLVDLDEMASASPMVERRYRGSELQRQRNLFGGVYTLPNERFAAEGLYPEFAFYANYDVLSSVNFGPVNTLAQYANAIKQYYDANKTFGEEKSIAFALPTAEEFSHLFFETAISALAGNADDGMIAVDSLKKKGALLADQYYVYEYIKFINDLYLQGYIDNSFFDRTQEEYEAALASGCVLAAFDYHAPIQKANDALAQADMPNRALIAVPVMLEGVTDNYNCGFYEMSSNGLSITTSCRNPEAGFAFLERLLADDAQKLLRWGVQGTDYELDAEGVFTCTEEQAANLNDARYRLSRGIGAPALLLAEGSFDEYYGQFDDYNWIDPQMNPQVRNAQYQSYEQQLLQDMGRMTFCDDFASPHVPDHTEGKAISAALYEKEEYAALEDKVRMITAEYYEKLIKCGNHKNLEATWAEYRGELEAISNEIDAYVEEFNRILAESFADYGK